MAITQLDFSKDWNDSSDFSTYEGSEVQVREDMQYLFDEIKNYINNTLIPGIRSEVQSISLDTQTTTEELNQLHEAGCVKADFTKLHEVTSSSTELNVLDGITASTAELNKLHGATVTTEELNILDGVTATAEELNTLDGITADTDELNILDGVTATTEELNILDGVTATAAELNTMDGITATTAELNKLHGATATTEDLNKLHGVTASASDLNKTTNYPALASQSTYIPVASGGTGAGTVDGARAALSAATKPVLLWTAPSGTEWKTGSQTITGFSNYKSVRIVTDEGAFDVTKIPGSTYLYGGFNLSSYDEAGTRWQLYFQGTYEGDVVTIGHLYEMEVAGSDTYNPKVLEVIGTIRNDEIY